MPNIIKLSKGRFLKLSKEGGRILEGEAWVTVPGVAHDFVLKSGDLLPCCYGNVLVEALSELRLETGLKLEKSIA